MGKIYIDKNGIINPYYRRATSVIVLVLIVYPIADSFDFISTFLPTPITTPLRDEVYYLIFAFYILVGIICAVKIQNVTRGLEYNESDEIFLTLPLIFSIIFYNFTLIAIPHGYTLLAGKHASKQYTVSSLFHVGDRKFCPTITLQNVPPFTSKLCALNLFEQGEFKEGTVIEVYGKQSALGIIAESAKIIKQ